MNINQSLPKTQGAFRHGLPGRILLILYGFWVKNSSYDRAKLPLGDPMFKSLLTKEEKELQEEARRFVGEEAPSSLIRAIDARSVKYP